MIEEQLTAVFQSSPQGYIAYVEELPGANSQGRTLEEARKNLQEAVQLVLAANRQLANEELEGKDHIREIIRHHQRMKRRVLIRHLESHGCEVLREGANHTVYVNRRDRKVTTVPRHREIDENLCLKICKDLGISRP